MDFCRKFTNDFYIIFCDTIIIINKRALMNKEMQLLTDLCDSIFEM